MFKDLRLGAYALNGRNLKLLLCQTCLHSVLSTEALVNEAVPTVLVSAKCDNPFKSWEVDQEKVENFCNTLNVESFQTSISAPETHKRCISVILRNIMMERCRESHICPLPRQCFVERVFGS